MNNTRRNFFSNKFSSAMEVNEDNMLANNKEKILDISKPA
jgi:hypothetical protein